MSMKNSIKFISFGMKFISFLLLACVTSCAFGMTSDDNDSAKDANVFEPEPKPVIVAVVDTGFDFESTWETSIKDNPGLKKPRMCKYGHKDFTGFGMQDHHGHGTHIAGLIAQYAADANYCIVAIKYFDNLFQGPGNLTISNKALQRAINIKVDMINYSGGGVEKSDEECTIIKSALDAGIVVVVAAGNEKSDINEKPYYPAMCDDRIIVVANTNKAGKYEPTSNFSNSVEINAKGLYKEVGNRVLSIIPGDRTAKMTGTSQAAAIKTGKIIKSFEGH